jgi:acetyl-CoA synthetase
MQATILAYQYERFDARAFRALVRCRVTSFCAPPTAWRMLIQHDLRLARTLRELASAGEPLNPGSSDRCAMPGPHHP